jgi:hypothetical protein
MTGENYADPHILGAGISVADSDQSLTAFVHDWILE